MKLKKLGFLACLPVLLLASCNTNNVIPSEESTESHAETTTDVETSSKDEGSLVEPPAVEGDYVAFHYNRKDNNYTDWKLWLWAPNEDGRNFEFNGRDEYGAIAKYPFTTWSANVEASGLNFIVKRSTPTNDWAEKDPDGDRTADFSKLTKQEDGGYHLYLQSGDSNIYVNDKLEFTDEISPCIFKSFSEINFKTSNAMESYKIYEDDTVLVSETFDDDKHFEVKYTFAEGKKADFQKSYNVEVKFLKTQAVVKTYVSMASLFNTKDFDEAFTYNGELGAIYTSEKTTFRVWSPISSEIKLRIYENGTPTAISKEKGSDAIYKEVTMTKGEKGVFETQINEDLEGKYYTYVVTNGVFKQREIVDPYAKSAGVSGLRGMIVDFNKTNPSGWDAISAHQYDRKQLTVYETHIADITSSETWGGTASNAKLFKGAYESGTTYTKNGKTVSTGFDHIKELGVNAVQFVPIFDQQNDETNMTFNWGYNPLNYNVLEGGYSTNPYDGYTRIKEFKELVKAYNEAGINIIMDVVYNHVAGAVGSNFDVLMPQYYYRYTKQGNLSNGSGCGNETASEMPMFRKFMMDSTKFWCKEYKLGGFRFDLMALHDLDTMEQVTNACKEINPSICIYGEPWTGGNSTLPTGKQARQGMGNKFKGYGQFNDQMRDALIAGGMSGKKDLGWADDQNLVNKAITPKIGSGIKGFTKGMIEIKDPNKTVNYVTCHDNYTLYDRFKVAGINDDALIKKMAMLANSIVLTSQGTTFMLAGEEFLRTKDLDHNSYKSSYKINELNYELKIDNSDMVENYKKLIELKQSVDGLHLEAADCAKLNVKLYGSGNYYKYTITDTANNKTYEIMHRNGYKSDEVITLDLTGYQLYLSTLDGNKVVNNATILNPFETLIVVK